MKRFFSRPAFWTQIVSGVAGSIVLFAVSPIRAAVLAFDDDPADFGTVAQNIGGDINNSSVACGPTSVYNSFVFLKNQSGGAIDLTGASAADTINTLETDMTHPGDTSFDGVIDDVDLVNGKTKYINDQGLAGKVTVESLINDPDAIPATDAATFIYNQLKKGQDVEIGWFWSDKNGNKTSGGHWATITGIDYDTTAGTGTFSIVDPWAATGDLTAPRITGSLNDMNNELVLGYTGGAAGNDGDTAENPDSAGYGFITGIAAESIPEPTTFSLVLISGMALLARRKARGTTVSQ